MGLVKFVTRPHGADYYKQYYEVDCDQNLEQVSDSTLKQR